MSSIKNYGHMGTVDTPFNLARAWDRGMVRPGCLAVIASSGAGFTIHRPQVRLTLNGRICRVRAGLEPAPTLCRRGTPAATSRPICRS